MKSISRVKRDATKLKRTFGITYTEALNRVVYDLGFKNYREYLREVNHAPLTKNVATVFRAGDVGRKDI